MEKNSFGKGAGLGGVIALIVIVLCQVMHEGVIPWVLKHQETFKMRLEKCCKNQNKIMPGVNDL